uniref:Trichohyalin-like n=1 Tax=Astyanax mexicanus TaxID=7994 RepID=A0A3B1JZ91_ASTMX
MRIFLLLFGSLAVAVALPVQDWVPVESLVAPPGERNPLLGDILPIQGRVIQEDPKPVVQVKPAELNPVQQNQLVKSKSLVEDVPVLKIIEETEERESVMNEPRGQVQAPLNMMEEHLPAEEPVEELEPVQSLQEVAELNPNRLEEDPMIQQEPEKEETFVEDEENFLQEEASKEGEELMMGLEPEDTLAEDDRLIIQEEELLDAVAPPIMELDAVPEPREVNQRSPNEFLEEPVMELEPKKEEVFVEDGENFLQEEASKEGEELEMGLEPQEALAEEERNILQEEELLDAEEAPVMEPHEVYHRNANEFLEEPVKGLEPEEEQTFVEDDDENFLQEEASKEGEELEMGLEPQEALAEEERNILQEEELLDAEEAPVMEPHEVYHRNANEFLEEPVMELEPDKEETFVEDDYENFLQEEASKEGEELEMGLEPQEALAEEERNILQEEELLDAVEPPLMELDAVPEPHEVHQRNPNEFIEEPAMELQPEETFVEDEDNFMQEEALMENPEAALYPALEYELSQDKLLMQHQIQQRTKEAESNMIENLPSEKELMMPDQDNLDEPLMNQNARQKREDSEMEPADGDPSSNRWRSCNGVISNGKCYVFFSGPKKAPDAEFFCQNNFQNGHLASVTSRYLHNQMMGLMDRNGGRRRTWIGGLRYLDTGRWIWLDGAQWGYADWLPGEPNNTAGVENCVEILSNGKFNDMPCWDLRAFICSYPY